MKKREAVPWAWIKIQPTHLSDQQHHIATYIYRYTEREKEKRTLACEKQNEETVTRKKQILRASKSMG